MYSKSLRENVTLKKGNALQQISLPLKTAVCFASKIIITKMTKCLMFTVYTFVNNQLYYFTYCYKFPVPH